jgi:uncharacterized protein
VGEAFRRERLTQRATEVFTVGTTSRPALDERRLVSELKALVERYFDGFRRSDHEGILACLEEDVVWDLAGFKHLEGKRAFDSEIENENFVGSPALIVDRMVEEGDTVVAIGTGAATQTSGVVFEFAFCDVFTFRGDAIRRVESYLVPLTSPEGIVLE